MPCVAQCVPADERWECHKNALNKAARDLLTLPTAAATTTTTTSSPMPAGSQSPAAEAKSKKQQIDAAKPVVDSDAAAGDVQVEALALWGLYGDNSDPAAGADY
jgi:hypothetical protein